MPIDIRVAGDRASCCACANALAALSEGTERYARSFFDVRDRSVEQWHGDAGDAFRDRIGAMGAGTIGLADRAAELSRAIRSFADELTTIAARMTNAAETAIEGGLLVTDREIGDPDSSAGPDTELWARQTAAYRTAQELVDEARAIERTARDALGGVAADLAELVHDSTMQWCWMGASAVTGYIGTAVEQAGTWRAVATTRAAQLDTFRTIAAHATLSGDPFREAQAARALGVFEKSAVAAERAAVTNSKLVLGMTDNTISQTIARALAASEGATTLSKVGSKIPYVGVLVTGAQTTADVVAAEDAGDVAKTLGKDVGGFVAGTAATSLILASASGGPATLLAVGAGVGVAYGVGAVIDHWDDISGGVHATGRRMVEVFE